MNSTITSFYEDFLETISRSPGSAILIDYETGFAPSSVGRNRTTVHQRLRDALFQVVKSGTKVVFVSGQSAREVETHLSLGCPVEIWGFHGVERLLTSGRIVSTVAVGVQHHLERVAEALMYEGLSDLIEMKPCGITIRWRGSSEIEAAEARVATLRAVGWVLKKEYGLYSVDNGFEYRPCFLNNANSVRMILAGLPEGTAVAYLGNDFFGEDAFAVLPERCLRVPIQRDGRRTAAQVSIKPPEDLERFFLDWAAAAAGEHERTGVHK